MKAGWSTARRDADTDQARYTNPCSVRSGELLPFVSKAWEACTETADAQAPRQRDVDQPAEDRLATLHNA